MQWVMIQKTFGPVHFERVGIAYHGDVITGQLDAALSAGGLTIALDGLSVTSPLSPFEPTFSLRELGIDYRNGPLEIGGSFLKQIMKEGEETYTSFAGLAVLRNKLLSLSAIGSYSLKGRASLPVHLCRIRLSAGRTLLLRDRSRGRLRVQPCADHSDDRVGRGIPPD